MNKILLNIPYEVLYYIFDYLDIDFLFFNLKFFYEIKDYYKNILLNKYLYYYYSQKNFIVTLYRNYETINYIIELSPNKLIIRNNIF